MFHVFFFRSYAAVSILRPHAIRPSSIAAVPCHRRRIRINERKDLAIRVFIRYDITYQPSISLMQENVSPPFIVLISG